MDKITQLEAQIAALVDMRADALNARDDARAQRDALAVALQAAIPLLVRLGDFIGNGPVNPNDPDSLGERCDVIGRAKDALEAVQS